MPEPLTDNELGQALGAHVPYQAAGGGYACAAGGDWPCPGVRAVSELLRLRARVRALAAENTLLRRIIHQHGITWFEPATITADDGA